MTQRKMRLGELLINKGLIDHNQLNSALAFQRQWGHRLGTALVALGHISELELVEVLGEALSIPVVDLATIPIQEAAVAIVPHLLAVENELIPIRVEHSPNSRKRTLTVAIADPLNVPALDEIEFTYDCKVRPVIAPLSAISSAIRKHYLREDTNIGPAPKLAPPAPPEAEEKMTLLQGGQYVDIYDQNPTEGTNPELPLIVGRPTRELPVRVSDVERMERLQKYVYALLRLMVRKGLLTKDEFFKELDR